MTETRGREERSDREQRPGLAAAGLGTEFAVAMAVFAGGGYHLDQRFGWTPVLTIVGAFLGLIYGGYAVWKLVRSNND